MAIYRDLLKLESSVSSVPRRLHIPNTDEVLPRLESRFLSGPSKASVPQTQDGGLATKLQTLLQESDVQQAQPHISAGKPYSAVLNSLQELATATTPQTLMASPIGVMTKSEWASLVQTCVRFIYFVYETGVHFRIVGPSRHRRPLCNTPHNESKSFHFI